MLIKLSMGFAALALTEMQVSNALSISKWNPDLALVDDRKRHSKKHHKMKHNKRESKKK